LRFHAMLPPTMFASARFFTLMELAPVLHTPNTA